MISKFFIDRPVFAFVIAILMSMTGVIALKMMPVSQYPNIVPPQVQISTTYPGADARTMQDTVVLPIESKVNGVKHGIYMSSTSSDTGMALTTVTFDLGTSGDINTVNTQNRQAWANALLPSPVQKQGIVVKEKSTSILLAMMLYSPDGSYDGLYLNNYLQINILNDIARLPGVSDAKLIGQLAYSMRIWLRPDKMGSMGLTVDDVISALNSQNVQVSAGSLGNSPTPKDQLFRYPLVTTGRLITKDEFENIIIRSKTNGAQVRFKDIGRVELGAQDYSSYAVLNGKPAAMLVIYQYNDGNGMEIARQCKDTMAQLSRKFPAGMAYSFTYDTTLFVKASIKEMVITLFEAIALVVLVTFIFLQDWRATLVPTIAIPVSLLATFVVLQVAGFSLNLISLFAMILAIGIVVDDAIVVIENVNRLMEEEGLSPRDAAIKSMDQVTAPIIATTAVLLAMFVPICFVSGITGALYRQFGITISVSVAFSAINALTLSPVLAAMLLKPPQKEKKENFLKKLFSLPFRIFNYCFNGLTGGYTGTVKLLVRWSFLILVLYLGISVFAVKFFNSLPTGFLPPEDLGAFFVNVQLPDNASLERSGAVAGKVLEITKKEEGVMDIVLVPGFSIFTATNAANNVWGIVTLKPWDERKTKGLEQHQIMASLQRKFNYMIPEAIVMNISPPTIPGIGSTGGFNFVVMDTSGTNPARMGNVLNDLIAEARNRPEFASVFTTFRSTSTQYFIDIDRKKALQFGVSMDSINNALQGMTGSMMINLFNIYDQVYQVVIQADQDYRRMEDDVRKIWVKNNGGKMVPLSSLVSFRKELTPQYLSRYNTYSSANIQGEQSTAFSSGEAMKAMEEIAGKKMPDDMKCDWTDMSYQERLSSGQVGIVFGLAIVFIYLFLAALYESWLTPLSVLLSVPVAFFGAIVFLYGADIELNLYTQVGFVLLIGMASKTAILIVEFAKKSHDDEKVPVYEAAVNAAKLRFRAVLMTAISFILGLLPLVVAMGAGAVSRRSVGFAVVGGMLFAVLFGTFLIPSFYVVMQKLIDLRKKPS